MAEFESYLASVGKELRAGWKAEKPKRLRATLDHAVRFSTWRSLAELRLGDAAMADLVCVWADAAAG